MTSRTIPEKQRLAPQKASGQLNFGTIPFYRHRRRGMTGATGYQPGDDQQQKRQGRIQ